MFIRARLADNRGSARLPLARRLFVSTKRRSIALLSNCVVRYRLTAFAAGDGNLCELLARLLIKLKPRR